jgi:hypothetical protein
MLTDDINSHVDSVKAFVADAARRKSELQAAIDGEAGGYTNATEEMLNTHGAARAQKLEHRAQWDEAHRNRVEAQKYSRKEEANRVAAYEANFVEEQQALQSLHRVFAGNK